MWYKEEDKEASKPAFLYTDTIDDTLFLVQDQVRSAAGRNAFSSFTTILNMTG